MVTIQVISYNPTSLINSSCAGKKAARVINLIKATSAIEIALPLVAVKREPTISPPLLISKAVIPSDGLEVLILEIRMS
jgi:hypothetical protein